VSELIASAEFCSNLGTIFIEAHELIDADPALAALSLSELRSKLDDKGFPVDLLIEQFNDLSQSNENVLDTFILQVKSRSYEPEGPQVLADCIENQGQQLSSSIHQLLDQSVQNMISIAEVGGGFGKKIESHPLASAVNHPVASVFIGATAAFGIGGSYKYWRRSVDYKEATINEQNKITEFFKRQSEEAADYLGSVGRAEVGRVEERPVNALKNIWEKGSDLRYEGDQIELTLRKDIKNYTDDEFRDLFEPFAKKSKDRFFATIEDVPMRPELKKLVKIQMADEIKSKAGTLDADLMADQSKAITLRIKEFDNDTVFKGLSDKDVDDFFLKPYKDAFLKSELSLTGRDGYLLKIDGQMAILDKDIKARLEKALRTLETELGEDWRKEFDRLDKEERKAKRAATDKAEEKANVFIESAGRDAETMVKDEAELLSTKLDNTVDNALDDVEGAAI
jgi:hypothetical protein